jgi:hypothetical protein
MATLFIHSIVCVSVSGSEWDPSDLATLNGVFDATAAAAATAGPYGLVAAGVLKAAQGIFNVVQGSGSSPDQLYLSLSNTQRLEKVWPLDREYYEISTGQMEDKLGTANLPNPFPPFIPFLVAAEGPLKIEFKDVINVRFWDHDAGGDDFMGRLTVDKREAGEVKIQLAKDAGDGAVYSVVYHVEAPTVTVPLWLPIKEGQIKSDLAVLNTLDDQLAIFGRGMDDELYWRTQINNKWDNTKWNPVGVPNEGMNGSPAVALDADGRINVFVQGEDNSIWRKSQLYRNSERWTEWTSLGGNVTSSPSAVLDRNGCLVVFARGEGEDKPLIHCWQTRRNSEWMPKWATLGVPGSILGAPAAALDYDGHIVVVAQGLNRAVWMIKQSSRQVRLEDDEMIGPSFISPALMLPRLPGKMEARSAVPNTAGTIQPRKDRTHGRWSNGWKSLGGIVSSAPSITKDADGWLWVFANGSDTKPDNSAFHRPIDNQGDDWYPLFGTLTGAVASTLTSDGRLTVFGVATQDNSVRTRFQIARLGDWLTETKLA